MKDAKNITLNNGRTVMMGACQVCGTTIWHLNPRVQLKQEKIKNLKEPAQKNRPVKSKTSKPKKKKLQKTQKAKGSTHIYRSYYIDDQAPDELSKGALQMERSINRIVSGSFETGKHR